MRDAEEQEKLKKHPKTTIRVRMPDYTIVQAVFQSREKGKYNLAIVLAKKNGVVSDVYAFIRTLLETPERKFVLCLPPRTKLVDPNVSLYKAGLSPASNVLFGWIEKGEKTNNDLKKEYLDMKEELITSTPVPLTETTRSSSTPSSSQKPSATKTVPKWLQKGLFKK